MKEKSYLPYKHNGESIFRGGGEMGALMREYNWNDHPLGSSEGWPQSLKAHIPLLLNSGFPMFIWWSKDFYMFHNDAYLPALGNKHPRALGASAREMWAEIWEQLGVVAEGILEKGETFYADSLPVYLNRKGFIEETYWTFSYSPAFNDEGEVEGVFCACDEVTNKIVGQRRLKTLKDISEATSGIQTLAQACQSACNTLNDNKGDIPFSLVYLLNGAGTEARLMGEAGSLPSEAAPQTLSLDAEEGVWPLAKVLRTKEREIVNLADGAFPQEDIPTFPVHKAVVLPVCRPGQDSVSGFFISGIHHQQEYNADYQSFHKLLAAQIASSISSVQAREELSRQQQYLKDVFQQAPVGITILRGPQYIIDLANPGMCELWGRKPEDVLGRPVLEAIPEAGSQGIKELLDRVLHTGVPYVNAELPLVLEREGQPEQDYFSLVYHPMQDARGLVSGLIAVAISIREQVRARHEIEEMNRHLLAINADLDNFVYSASHDLKAPISNIEGLMRVLKNNLPFEALALEKVQRTIGFIQASIERFKRAVTDLAEVAKVQREAEEDVALIEVAEVVEDVRLDFESLIAESGACIETFVKEGAAIRFSAKNLRSILYNLLSNGLKYRSPDRVPHLKISAENTPEYTILSVADNGLGIDLSKERQMFSMFKRLHDHVEGTGVGLYIVKRIVENAGGKIEVESQLGKGSTFRVFFKNKPKVVQTSKM